MSEKQSRIFTGILYPDAVNYDCAAVLVRIEDTFRDMAYIVHDKDVNEHGELKKPHIHWVAKRDTPCPLSTIVNALKIPSNDIEYCKSFRSSLRYLVHADNKDKYQYDPDLVKANFPYIDVLRNRVEQMKARLIFEYIHSNPCTPDSLCAWCLDNDLWSEYRRNFALWCTLIREVQFNG